MMFRLFSQSSLAKTRTKFSKFILFALHVLAVRPWSHAQRDKDHSTDFHSFRKVKVKRTSKIRKWTSAQYLEKTLPLLSSFAPSSNALRSSLPRPRSCLGGVECGQGAGAPPRCKIAFSRFRAFKGQHFRPENQRFFPDYFVGISYDH